MAITINSCMYLFKTIFGNLPIAGFDNDYNFNLHLTHFACVGEESFLSIFQGPKIKMAWDGLTGKNQIWDRLTGKN